jgi:hypothetical protein
MTLVASSQIGSWNEIGTGRGHDGAKMWPGHVIRVHGGAANS